MTHIYNSVVRTLRRPETRRSIRPHHPQDFQRQCSALRTYATARAPQTDKSRILEKPTRFNPPSHGSRRVRPRQYPGPRLTDLERETQKTKRYPNMMPPEGTMMHSFLTSRAIHLWITLSVLVSLAGYSMSRSFLHTTIYRDQLPLWGDLLSHPFQTMGQFINVYKMHVAYESEKVAEKRRMKMEDAVKRKEFLREHGVEPGFLTGSWMDKFGTVEGDKWKAEREGRVYEPDGPDTQSPVAEASIQGPTAMVAGSVGAPIPVQRQGQDIISQDEETQQPTPERRKVKKWLGIW